MRNAAWLILLFAAAFGGVFGVVKWREGAATPKTAIASDDRDSKVSAPATHKAPAKVTTEAPTEAPDGMVWIPGGEFVMGTNDQEAWPEERPAHRVRVDGFFIDAAEVTNEEFAKFVEATGYQTTAERAPTLEEIMKQVPPGTPPPPPEKLVAGSLVFTPTESAVRLDDFRQWWRWTPGADWRHPEGPGSDIQGRAQHPVVQVSWDDAVAYAQWAGKRLPTEAEWEFASRGGLQEKPFTWGDEPLTPQRANIWQGSFPFENSEEDGFYRTAPVKTFPANGYGLHDMAGNVWEWCSDWYDRGLYKKRRDLGVAVNPQGPADPVTDGHNFAPQRVQRGGSFLCCDQYCSRYRPSARHGSTPDSGMSHVGFRCVTSANAESK